MTTTLKNFGKILEVVQPSALSSALFAQIQLSLLEQHYVQRTPIALCPHFPLNIHLIIISHDKVLNLMVVQLLLWIEMTTPLQPLANEILHFLKKKKKQKFRNVRKGVLKIGGQCVKEESGF